MLKRFKLHYLRDSDDSCPKYYESEESIKAGDAIQVENGFWHAVHEIQVLKTCIKLVLAQSAQSADEAKLLRQQMIEE
ncbi:hypothetical protein [Pseudomonas sp. BN515]|uniref:hypothetical protein n=1 Tax=Pseudomonas sp. BN515 TaxID=2567892 RepID=UPI002454B7DA|nr:hypothetical protein [Pseudomonas sp. BN515]MDH4872753.1 hypothetical protein [Pseudomonas sp. BN515]